MEIKPYTVTCNGKNTTIQLSHPKDIYHEEFIPDLASQYAMGKTVEIDCGRKSPGAYFAAEEITSQDFQDKIYMQDRYEFQYQEPHLRRIKLFSSKKSVFVVFIKHEANACSKHLDDEIKFDAYKEYDPDNDSSDEDLLDNSEDYIPSFILKSKEEGISQIILKGELPSSMEFNTIERKVLDGDKVEILGRNDVGNNYWNGIIIQRTGYNEISIDMNGRHKPEFSIFEQPDIYQTKQYYSILNSIIKYFHYNWTIRVNWDLEKPSTVKETLINPPFNLSPKKLKVTPEWSSKEACNHTISIISSNQF